MTVKPLNWLALFIATLLGLAGCESYGPKNPLVVLPKQKDWEAARATLRPEEISELDRCAFILDVSEVSWGGNIYQFRYGPPNGHPFNWMRLDLPGICRSYTDCSPARSHKSRKLLYAGTFCGYGGEDEWPTHAGCSVELDWKFADANGSITLSEKGYARTTKDEPLEVIANKAFAQAFLRLMLDLERVN